MENSTDPKQDELANEETSAADLLPLLEYPREKVNALINSESKFEEAITQLLNGSGPIAVDTERASGFTYSPRAYLVQIYRRGGGLHLIDPVAFSAPSAWEKLNQSLLDAEWIIHAATQDLPSLRQLGINPKNLFDTELGARIAGLPRVSLGALTEHFLGFRLAKEHSAVNWSSRPLLPEWLNYAALDVDVLVDLRDAVAAELTAQNKITWAQSEFEHTLNINLAPEKIDPWRKTSGIHKLRSPKALGVLRALWFERDKVAQSYDIAPGRYIPDDLLIEFANRDSYNIEKMSTLINKRTRFASSTNRKMPPELMENLFRIYQQAHKLEGKELPPMRLASTELPPARLWKDKNLAAYARYTYARVILEKLSESEKIPTENALSGRILRDFLWEEPPTASSEYENYTRNLLAKLGARNWQIDLVAKELSTILGEVKPLVLKEEKAEEEIGQEKEGSAAKNESAVN